MQTKYIIIGAGLSGLTTAYKLWEAGETDFLVLESRDRIGGRVFTKNGVDFGATWFQNHHTQVHSLLSELDIATFPQYSEGKSILVYSSMAPAHEFRSDPSAPAASRIAGGTETLIKALSLPIENKLELATKVLEIKDQGETVSVRTDNGVFRAQKIINTIPPRLSTGIDFNPPLPKTLWAAMENTHTWMSNAMKLGMTFERPFWREKGFSGMMIGQVGAVTELYDHSSAQDDHYTLMGFINEGLREYSPEDRKERILSYIQKYLGDEGRNFITYQEKDWYQDSFTSCERLQSVYISPRYGNPIFQKTYMDGKLKLSGAETSVSYGGYMEGAIQSGSNGAQFLLE